MNLNAYQDAINRGFSERESVRIGEDAYESDMTIVNRARALLQFAEVTK